MYRTEVDKFKFYISYREVFGEAFKPSQKFADLLLADLGKLSPSPWRVALGADGVYIQLDCLDLSCKNRGLEVVFKMGQGMAEEVCRAMVRALVEWNNDLREENDEAYCAYLDVVAPEDEGLDKIGFDLGWLLLGCPNFELRERSEYDVESVTWCWVREYEVGIWAS